MKHLYLGSLLVLFFICAQQAGAQNVPDYEQVIKKFYEQYQVERQIVEFAKKPDGWFVVLKPYDTPGKKTEIGFWNPRSKSFHSLDLPLVSDRQQNMQELQRKLRNEWKVRQFRLQPYFGYPGWEKDAIKALEKQPELSDSMLYALGRAYSSYASNLLNNFSSFSDPQLRFDLPPGKNSMTQKQLKEYRKYRHKAISLFKELHRQNSDFETLIGDIYTKYSNEHLTAFLDLCMYQNETEAKKELPEKLYSEFYIATAKNYLMSCDSNAVLFTNGDNDTYPLLYVQAKYSFRSDVLVVNLSLLNTARYINHLREKVLEAAPLKLSLAPQKYAGNERSIILISEQLDSVSLKNAIAFIDSDAEKTKVNNMHYIPSKKIIFQPAQTPNKICMELSQRYITLSHLIVLDFFEQNLWQRPVYFAYTTPTSSHLGLNNHLQVVGLTMRLSPEKKQDHSTQPYENGVINPEKLSQNLLKNFIWRDIENTKQSQVQMVSVYRNLFRRLASTFLNQNKKDSALLILDESLRKIPPQIKPYNYDLVLIAENYLKLGEKQKAKELIGKIKDTFIRDISDYTEMRMKNIVAGNNMSIVMALMEELIRITAVYELKNLNEELEIIYSQYAKLKE